MAHISVPATTVDRQRKWVMAYAVHSKHDVMMVEWNTFTVTCVSAVLPHIVILVRGDIAVCVSWAEYVIAQVQVHLLTDRLTGPVLTQRITQHS